VVRDGAGVVAGSGTGPGGLGGAAVGNAADMSVLKTQPLVCVKDYFQGS